MIQSSNIQTRSVGMKIFTDDQIWEIRQAAFDIIERVGFKCGHKQVHKMMKQAGARVKDNHINIPRHIVEECLATTPKGWIIYDRNGKRAMEVEGEKSHYGTSTASPNTRDAFTGDIRPTCIKDIELGAKVADYLDGIDFVMPMGSAQDVPGEAAEVHEFEAMVSNTTKPSVVIGYTALGCEYVYEMAAVIAGGQENLSKKPFIIAYPEAIAPLFFPDEVIERIFVAADRFMPQLPGSTVQPGATGPVTLAGVITLITAESLIHITIAQLRKKGCPVAMSGNVGILDMKTALMAVGAPETNLALAAQAEVARSFNLPTWGLAGATDSKMLDAQAGIESAFSILSQGLSGLNLIHDVGYMASGMACSLEQLVMGNEVVGMTKRFVEGITVTRETIARQIIEDVGPGGHFLVQQHTMNHFKEELWNAKLLNRQTIDAWNDAGKPSMEDRVKEEVRMITETHKPEPLSDKIISELDRLKKEGEREILAKLEKG
ncbi:MAG: trimethylamine methyltransferase family protein [Desulfobacula sp.]|uniref:trimethylamine methyltransferase family protein n=1 Tax=Desulfobacula sp. TaxID=2593537 RepID=UPI0025C62A04|nr:trimethylamine methyltransferase family protein [Desulfobacula sp.]MCD4719538.1 trimethylamine methyltransferase family protein [Desulfobacula sp.]